MSNEHTPGPWYWQNGRLRSEAEGRPFVLNGQGQPFIYPDFGLIAAAPDLLAACEDAVSALDNADEVGRGIAAEKARAAIGKARA